MILGFLGEEGVANGWEWPNTPSLTHPHLKLEHYNTFHSLMFNGIVKKNRGGQFRLTILYLVMNCSQPAPDQLCITHRNVKAAD